MLTPGSGQFHRDGTGNRKRQATARRPEGHGGGSRIGGWRALERREVHPPARGGEKEEQQEKELLGTLRKAKPENKGGREGAKTEKFGKFNKYAAARKAQKEGGWKSKTAKLTDEEKLLRDALRPKFGKALSKSAVAQRIAANPKSAALRKTSKNNPINKAKRAAHRKNRNHEGDE